MLRKRTFLYVGIFLSYMQSYFILKLPQEHVFSQSIKCLLLISGTHTCITWSGIPICTYIFPPNPQNDAFWYWQLNLMVLVIIAPSQHGRFDSFQQCCNDRMYANKYLIYFYLSIVLEWIRTCTNTLNIQQKTNLNWWVMSAIVIQNKFWYWQPIVTSTTWYIPVTMGFFNQWPEVKIKYIAV